MKKICGIFVMILLVGISGCGICHPKHDNVKQNAEKSFDNLDAEKAKTKN